jgi:hypothetical protein
MRNLTNLERLELSWLAQQAGPVWGAHLERGEPVEITALANYVERGLIERWKDGYGISEVGRAALTVSSASLPANR